MYDIVLFWSVVVLGGFFGGAMFRLGQKFVDWAHPDDQDPTDGMKAA